LSNQKTQQEKYTGVTQQTA